ncbi:MAG: rRNA adenine dimethyltransferase family protein [Candidatus Nitrosotenuis sp.]|nr:rRNA adenine dimethyltransferase family protein [Candidatus Nitrosotenuis uzonensis]
MSKSKRQRLGQHFLKSQSIARDMVDAANITKKDVVFEIGTGRGILTPLLCQNAKHVISAEADRDLYSEALVSFADIENLDLVRANGFEIAPKFSVFVSSLPYSKSRQAIEYLAQASFSRAVIMVQKEFADKLGYEGKAIRAISVIANHAFEIEKIMDVGRHNFEPPPKVDSVVLRLRKKAVLSEKLVRTVNLLFSYRRKTISNIAKKFGKSIQSEKRLEELGSDEVIRLAKQLI